jgi:hypothetical protein
MWFEKLTGFKEESPDQVRSNIEINGNTLTLKINGAYYQFANLYVISLAELKAQLPPLDSIALKIQVEEVIGNIQSFHKEESNNGAFFQAASQFNLLEMVGPSITPEQGVGIYEMDNTQGPACAIACGAGTIYRNYFAEVEGQIGQSSLCQIDCLADIGVALNNVNSNLWEMSNGYAMASRVGLKTISEQLQKMSEIQYEELKGKLKIGVQWDTEVTIGEKKNRVSQAYCSALPVSYSNIPSELWSDFACLILEATYEATFFAALQNYSKTGNNKVFLTLVGGGAFGNETKWIMEALKKALFKFNRTPLDIKIVSFGRSKSYVKELFGEF